MEAKMKHERVQRRTREVSKMLRYWHRACETDRNMTESKWVWVCVCLCVCVRAHFQCRKWICGVAAVQSEWNNWLPIDPPLPLRTVLSTALLHRLIWSTACVHLYSVVCVCMHMAQHVCNPSGRKPQYKPAATIKAKKAWVTCDIWKMKSERERERTKKCWITHPHRHTQRWGSEAWREVIVVVWGIQQELNPSLKGWLSKSPRDQRQQEIK